MVQFWTVEEANVQIGPLERPTFIWTLAGPKKDRWREQVLVHLDQDQWTIGPF